MLRHRAFDSLKQDNGYPLLDPSDKAFSNQIDLISKLMDAALYYLGQDYNYGFLNPLNKHNRSYCSELVKKVYRKVGIQIKHGAVWPVLLEELAHREEWSNISTVQCLNLILSRTMSKALYMLRVDTEFLQI